MKIRGSKSQILYGVQVVENTVSIKPSLPILSNILMEADEKSIGASKLRMTTTNLEITTRCMIPINIEEPGGITIPVRLFSSIIRELPEKELTIQTKENNIVIECEKSVFKVFGLPPNEFPSPPKPDEIISTSINSNILKDIIRKTRFAVSTDETRHALTGVNLTLKDNRVKMVATDGHRLAFIGEQVPTPPKEELSVIVPTKVLNEIIRIFPEEGEKVKVSIGKNYILFSLENILIMSRLVEGTFPNYEQVIPKEPRISVQANTKALLESTRRISLLTDEKSNLIKVKVEKGKLLITGSTPSAGEGKEEIDCTLTGEEIEVGFNVKYLLDILRAMDTEEVVIRLTNPASPVLLQPFSKDPKEDNYLCVVMPLRL